MIKLLGIKDKKILIGHNGIGKRGNNFFVNSPRIDSQWIEKERRQIVISITGWVNIKDFEKILSVMAQKTQEKLTEHIEIFKQAEKIESI